MGTTVKGKENPWKIKAVERSKELKSVNKELARQYERAEKWRTAFYGQSGVVKAQAAEIKAKSLTFNGFSDGPPSLTPQSPHKSPRLQAYKYPLSVIWLCVVLYRGGLSLRGTCGALVFIRDFLGIKFKIPSYGAVRVWVYKQGLYLLKKGGETAKKGGEKWALIVDESYSLGKSRLLLVLAVRTSSLKQGQRLALSDVPPVMIRSSRAWSGGDVSLALKEAAQKLDGTIAYVVSDRGNNLVRACQQNGLPHVPDWSHYTANILESIYAKDDGFKRFNEEMGKFKKKRKQSVFADYSPPTLSVKMRFMNYLPFLEWANIMLGDFDRIPAGIAAELRFLKEQELFIAEMTDMFCKADEIGLLLKTEGICPRTHTQGMKQVGALGKKYPDNARVACFAQGVNLYFGATMPVYHKYAAEAGNVAPVFNAVLASSEIIESIFGKFKHRCLRDPKRGFSAIALIIPLFCRDFSPFEVFKAMSSISNRDMEIWEKDNLTEKGYNSFRNVFKKFNKKSKRGACFANAA